MEVKSARTVLGLDHAAKGVDNSGSDSENRQIEKKDSIAVEKEKEETEEAVKVFISSIGMRKSMHMENETADLMTEEEIEEMMKKVEGLSSQVINGRFSIDAKMSFQREIKELTAEIKQLNGDGISFSKADNIQLSQKISDLTKKMNEAAVYHRPANAYSFVKSQKMVKRNIHNSLDIAI